VRVALLDLPSYTPPYDHSLAAALARRGHEVTVLTTRFPYGEAPAPEGYTREELFFPVSGRLRRLAPRSPAHRLVKAAEYAPSVRRLRRRLDTLAPDVVHVQWLALPERDLRWLGALGRPTVFTAHDLLGRRENRRSTWVAVCRAVDRVVVHSERGREELEEAGVERDRIEVIPHPVFELSAHEPSPPNGTTLLFFGLLRAYKGLDLLVQALARVPEARLVVAGDPVDPVEPIRRLAFEQGVRNRIEWRLGFLPDAEVSTLMAGAAAVVLPYRQADSSGVLATAFAHGRPAIVSDVGGLADAVRAYHAGLVVPPDDVEALADACRALLADPGPAYRGALAARAGLSWEAAAERHERLYRDLLSVRRA
jgi:glycosyltransferase involved in cell wall biosynthesis